MARAADHQRVSEFQFTQNAPGKLGLHPAGIGQLDIGAAGVLARFRPFGLAVAEQYQSVVVQAHAE